MTKLSHILAGTDLSGSASYATDRAALLAAARGASLTLVHAIGSSAMDDLRHWASPEARRAEEAISAQARSSLERAASELRERHGISVATHFGTGHPVAEMQELGRRIRADLIVVGGRGEGSGHRLTGSVADKLVRTAIRPVLLVRAEPRQPYKRLLVPVDFSIWSEVSIHLARRVAPEAELVLIHAVDCHMINRRRLDGIGDAVLERCREHARAEALGKLQELAAQNGLEPGSWTLSVSTAADPWTAIVHEQQSRDCDLIVIGKQGRSAISEFLLGSVARLVIEESSCDVLISAKG